MLKDNVNVILMRALICATKIGGRCVEFYLHTIYVYDMRGIITYITPNMNLCMQIWDKVIRLFIIWIQKCIKHVNNRYLS